MGSPWKEGSDRVRDEEGRLREHGAGGRGGGRGGEATRSHFKARCLPQRRGHCQKGDSIELISRVRLVTNLLWVSWHQAAALAKSCRDLLTIAGLQGEGRGGLRGRGDLLWSRPAGQGQGRTWQDGAPGSESGFTAPSLPLWNRLLREWRRLRRQPVTAPCHLPVITVRLIY